MNLPTSTTFKVVAISSNRNSFGLRGMVLMAKNGVVYQVGTNDLNAKSVGDEVHVPCNWDGVDADGIPQIEHHFHQFGWEIPERLPDAPDNVIDEVWGDRRG
jgi:hypothetical protein